MLYVKAIAAAELKDGEKKKLTLEDREIMLARAAGIYYAIDNRCPHFGGDLSAGTLDGKIIACPRHASQFDIATGEVLKWTNLSGPVKALGNLFKGPRPVKTYRVKVENGDVLVEV